MNARNMSTQPTRSSGCGCSGGSGNGGSNGDCGCEPGCDSRCCELECLVRPNFFCGQLLTDADLAAMVDWTRKRLSLARYRDGWGIACGLDLSCSDPGGSTACCDDAKSGPAVYLGSGYAIDCCGNDLVVCEPMRVDLSSVCTAPDDPCNPVPAPPADPAGQSNEDRGSCLEIDRNGLYAVQVSLRYRENLSHGMRAMFRGSCSDEGPCEYSRVLEAPCVHVEEIPLQATDRGERQEDAWTADFRNYLRRELADLRALLDKGIDEVARYVARNPPYQMCFLQEVICCVRDHAETPQPGRRNASTLELTTVGMYLLIDRLLRHLRCGCGECKPDTGVPIGRVLMRRTVFKGKTRCTVVSIDPGFDHRRLLRKDTCRPIAEGMVDLLPYLWQTPAYAQMQLRKQTCAQDVNFEKRTVSMGVNGFDEPMSMLAKQPLSIARADLGRLVAHTIVDPFKDARIAAFSLAN
jgi:hypothetical protein